MRAKIQKFGRYYLYFCLAQFAIGLAIGFSAAL